MDELVKYEEKKVLEAFSDPEGLDFIIDEVRTLVDNFDHDLSSVKGRKEATDFSRNISKFKGKIDDLGKDAVSEWKTKAKKVDINRKAARDSLDELKIIARKPVTDWEAEQIRIATEKMDLQKAEELRKELEDAEEFAVLMNREFDREKADKLVEKQEQDRLDAEQAEKERIDREDKIKKQAVEQVIIEAKQKARDKAAKVAREKQEALEREQQLKDQFKQAEINRIAAEKRRVEDKKAAKKRADEAAENARLAEIRRQEEKKAREHADLQKREANKKHVGAVLKRNEEALMVNVSEIDQKLAKEIILAIKNGVLPDVSIKI